MPGRGGDDIYSHEWIELEDLREFAQVALRVLNATEYGRAYASQLSVIALCQGAANHFAVLTGAARRYFEPSRAGVKDIDIWFFFAHAGFNARWRRNHDLGVSKFGHNPPDVGYTGRRMDFFGRSIQSLASGRSEAALRAWLASGKPGTSAWCLAQKAVVGLYPEPLVGKVLWVAEALI